MKPFLLGILFFIINCAARAQVYVGQQQDLPYRDTSKHIASMRSSRYLASIVNGKVIKGQKTDEVLFYYDKHGNLAKRVIVFPVQAGIYKHQPGEDNMTMQHAFNDSAVVVNPLVYDGSGNLIVLPHDPLLYHLSGTFKYNSHNQLTELKQYNHYKSEAPDRVETFKYNDKDKLTERTERDYQKQLLTKTTFDYDKAGHITEVTTSDSVHMVSRTKLIYDNLSGKLMHLILINDDGRLPTQYDYEYDAKDRKAKIYMVYNATKQLYSVFKYNPHNAGYQYTENAQGQTIVQTISAGQKKRETFEGEHPRNLQEWQYDKRNNVTQHLVARYPLPSQKIEPINVSVVVNDIKYRGGVFSRVGMWFKKKVYPPRAGGM